jgi:hypothetical protein
MRDISAAPAPLLHEWLSRIVLQLYALLALDTNRPITEVV